MTILEMIIVVFVCISANTYFYFRGKRHGHDAFIEFHQETLGKIHRRYEYERSWGLRIWIPMWEDAIKALKEKSYYDIRLYGRPVEHCKQFVLFKAEDLDKKWWDIEKNENRKDNTDLV